MRARDLRKLKTGDYVSCMICPDNGCNGKPKRVIVCTKENPSRFRSCTDLYEHCTCTDYYHTGNDSIFGWDPRGCLEHLGDKPKLVGGRLSDARKIHRVTKEGERL